MTFAVNNDASVSERSMTHREIMVIFSGLMMTMVLPILDQTIVATALPTIASNLGGDAHIAWVPTSYLLTTTITAPLYGKISDRVGRKSIYQLAIVIFLVGSVCSGLAHNMTQLIAFRARATPHSSDGLVTLGPRKSSQTLASCAVGNLSVVCAFVAHSLFFGSADVVRRLHFRGHFERDSAWVQISDGPQD